MSRLTEVIHSGRDPRTGRLSASSTQHMPEAYNPALRQYVIANHYMDTFAFHAISGRDRIARFGYSACK